MFRNLQYNPVFSPDLKKKRKMKTEKKINRKIKAIFFIIEIIRYHAIIFLTICGRRWTKLYFPRISKFASEMNFNFS